MSSRPNKLTPAQIDEAMELRERGCSCAAIGERFGVSGSTIEYHCLRCGVEPEGPRVYLRNGRPVRGFSDDDDAELQRLALEIPNRSEIARRLRRRPGVVINRLHILARRQERARRQDTAS